MKNPEQITSKNKFSINNQVNHYGNEDNYLLLPQSQEAEQAVLGAIFAQNECLNKVVEILHDSN